jgi:two-component system chemotaxis response regulator CheV
MTSNQSKNEMTNITGDILLDAGTNELEVLVFSLNGGWFGVNVAKVREVIRPVDTTVMPHQHESVIGIFNIRGTVLPVVDLAHHLDFDPVESETTEECPEGRVIITEFNGQQVGFNVTTVDQIYRVSWSDIKPSPDLEFGTLTEGQPAISSTTGSIEIKDHLVLMLDFESIADEILCEQRLHIDSVENDLNVDRASKRVVIVEDSPFMRNLVKEIFINSGYTAAEFYSDGAKAWDAISSSSDTPIDVVVSDIEMPLMDGLNLTARIKENKALSGVPVILFSSLISEDNRKKGQQVGADVQISKPEVAEMVHMVDLAVLGRIDELKQKHAA